ncbi:hypothetical protein GGD92_01835 [Pseudomonas protegens]|uniref:Uncharacterized protein n=1 Tax=Pseudomonas protegens TaxID=380021 RepID=A0A7G7XAR1_9PSED|nr:hypothetical protein [Pseudomonas protegens]QNH77056.1 hypothetical protein GGI48_27970 [Pseudomonas protegens]QNL06251.1 hypothetical protein GGD92_01835 [Pseudomonas protegens]
MSRISTARARALYNTQAFAAVPEARRRTPLHHLQHPLNRYPQEWNNP